MLVSYIVLVLCTVAIVGSAIALFLRVRAHTRKVARDEHDQQQPTTKF